MNQKSWPIIIHLVIAAGVISATLSSIAAAQTPRQPAPSTIVLGIASAVHQQEIESHYSPLVRYVARRISPAADTEGKVVVADDLAQLVKLLDQKTVDFYIDSAYPTYVVNHVHGAAKLLLRRWQRGKAEYQSLIFTKRDSGVARLDDLRGKIIAFEDPESTSGHFLAKFFLLRNGFKLAERTRADAPATPSEIGYLFAHSQEKLLDLVLSKQVAAGVFSDDDYAKLDEKQRADINVLAKTELLPRHLLSVRKDMAPALADRLEAILLSMHEDDEGRSILQKTADTTKFDRLPGGEEGMRRRLLETFFSVQKK
jgi:phosphonate transport system substrate-binding protein